MATDCLVKIDEMTKRYKDYELKCSLEVRPGQITGLIGQNGAGKSTAFKALLGLIKTDGGNVTVLGKNPGKLTVEDKKRIGVVFAESGFSSYLSVKDIVPILKTMYENFDRDDFVKKCEHFKLPLDKQIKNFSTGMKAKLKVLVALSHDADLLILDEPTSGLDVIARDEILKMLREYMAEHTQKAILISSHISSDLENLCDDLYMIHNGSIVLHEDTDVLLGEYGILKVEEEQMQKLDQRAIIKKKKEKYGYSCLTRDRNFYIDNYPEVIVEKSSIDDLIYLMIMGE